MEKVQPKLSHTEGRNKFGKIFDDLESALPKRQSHHNNVDGWILIVYGEQRVFTKLKTSDVLITSGLGNSKVERAILDSYLEDYSESMKIEIEERIKKRELLGGMGTAFVRDNLYPKLGS